MIFVLSGEFHMCLGGIHNSPMGNCFVYHLGVGTGRICENRQASWKNSIGIEYATNELMSAPPDIEIWFSTSCLGRY